ncbi:hypothetical protein C8F04DRAFT_173183 [Mycena alexandri]|uniref:F-box domain-containing protein n=1 Tax=Mycena alexandri TaxID=1745969 RepID=A0AAD6TC49_9AGAR|nr:hypothetical protein C8F04DRAFT_173183 [Mycena alexandri]
MSIGSLAALLESNDVPLPSQRSLVEEILRDKRAELAASGDAISQLQFTLNTLQAKHAELASEISQYDSILSPVRRIPPEIIGEIFLYFTPVMHPDSESRNHDRVNLPWKLGHICHLWRAVSLSLEQLWSVLDLGAPWPVGDRTPQLLYPDDEKYFTRSISPHCAEGYGTAAALEYIDRCLQRSSDRPLSLRLWTHNFAAVPLLDGFLKCSARWGQLVLVDPESNLLNRLSRFAGQLLELRKMAMSFMHGGPMFFFQDWQCIPNLTNLTLTRVFLPSESFMYVPWSRLTRYCEIDCTWEFDWLEGTGRLASYRQLTQLCTFCLESDTPAAMEPLLLPNLRAAFFAFRGSYGSPFEGIQSFEMPMLELFSLRYPYALELSDCVPAYSPRLKVLRAQIECVDGPDMEHVMKTFPDLTELTIDIPSFISNADILRLIPFHDELPLNPKLQIIRLSNRSFVHNRCHWKTLVHLLQARFRPAMGGMSALRTFEFSTDLSSDENVITGLKALAVENRWNIIVRNKIEFLPWHLDELNV